MHFEIGEVGRADDLSRIVDAIGDGTAPTKVADIGEGVALSYECTVGRSGVGRVSGNLARSVLDWKAKPVTCAVALTAFAPLELPPGRVPRSVTVYV